MTMVTTSHRLSSIEAYQNGFRNMSDQSAATNGPESGTEVDPRLLEILVCPVTKGPLEYDRARGELISRSANLAYPVRDGIPIMLAEEARPLDDSEA